jgi:hypothetical protein
MSLKSLINSSKSDGSIGHLVQELNNEIVGKQLIPSSLGQSVLSTESMDAVTAQDLRDTATVLQDTISNIVASLESEFGIADANEAQIEAGTLAGMLATNPVDALGRKLPAANAIRSGEGTVIDSMGMEDAFNSYSLGIEAYDERENKNAIIYSIAYNIQASRQDEFGEAFFPTVVISPDEVGIGIDAQLMLVYKNFQRDVQGTLDLKKYQAINVLRAYRDPTILKNDMTRAVPVARTGTNDSVFLTPYTGVAPGAPTFPSWDVDLGNNSPVTTAPLLPGARFSLLGVSSDDELIALGKLDATDALDPTVNVDELFINTNDGAAIENFIVPVNGLPKSNFTYSTQGHYREMTLNFESEAVTIEHGVTQTTAGAPETLLEAIVPGGKTVMYINMSGMLNLETSDMAVYVNEVSVAHIYDANGNRLADGDPAYAAVAALFTAADAGVRGYTIEAYRTNSNRRQRGQMMKVDTFTQLYNVPIRNSITVLRPTGTNGNDQSDLTALTSATRIRTSNAAVTALLEAAGMLRNYSAVPVQDRTVPEILGVGRFFVQPYYSYETVDMVTVVDSLKSSERAVDIQEALLTKIRDQIYNAYNLSEYQAANDALHGGAAPMPTVILGTDPVLARYLMANGDLRTLGGQFNVKIVTTLDKRMENKIICSFGDFSSSRNSAPNPMNFGVMAWAPEVTVTLPISRGGQISKELAVSPRFRHIVNLPVMVELDITNLEQVLNKVTQNVSQ